MAEVISIQQDTGSTGIGSGEIAGVRYRGNSFTAVHNNVTGIMLQLNSTGSKDLRIDIFLASSDVPTGSSLGGYTIPNASLTTSYTQYTFATPVTGLSIGTKYCFQMAPYSSGVYSDDYRDVMTSLSNPYTDGTHFKYESGTYQTEGSLDTKFRLYADDAAGVVTAKKLSLLGVG